MTELPVVVIGAGPIGLAAAAQLRERGLTPLVFERGAVAGAAIAEWNHVRLFSRWSELVGPGCPPSSSSRTGGAPPTEMRTRPDSSGGSSTSNPSPPPSVMRCSSVPRWSASPDAAATWSSTPAARPNLSPFTCAAQAAARTASSLRPSSMRPALGAPRTRSAGKDCPPSARRLPDPRSPYRVPDLDDEAVRARFAGKHTVIAGSGHSALTAIVALAGLEAEAPGTRITWAVRRGSVGFRVRRRRIGRAARPRCPRTAREEGCRRRTSHRRHRFSAPQPSNPPTRVSSHWCPMPAPGSRTSTTSSP